MGPVNVAPARRLRLPARRNNTPVASGRLRPWVEGRSGSEVCNSTSPACQRWTELARKCEDNLRQREAGYMGRQIPYCDQAETYREQVTGVAVSSASGAYDF